MTARPVLPTEPCPTCGDAVAGACCRVCGEAGLSSVLCLGRAPLANEFVPAEAAPSARYPLHVMHCDRCALAQLASGVAPERLFREYAYFSSASAPLVSHGTRLRDYVVRELRPSPGGLVVEIGSNDGYLLRDYATLGYRVLGVDPARNVAAVARANGVPTLSEFFSAEVAEAIRREHGPSSVIHANNVLAHVPDVLDVLRGFRILLDEGAGHVVIETAYVVDLVERGLFDTVYHEHAFYYSLTALDRLLRAVGLVAVDVDRNDVHGGSLRVVAAVAPARARASVAVRLAAEQAAGLVEPSYYAKFADQTRAYLSGVRDELASIVARGDRLAGFGAAAKGTIMVSATGAPVAYVCDTTPYKQGRMLPGTRVPIVPPDHLLADRPPYCVILAWNYSDAIIAANREYLRGGGTSITTVDFRLQYVDA